MTRTRRWAGVALGVVVGAACSSTPSGDAGEGTAGPGGWASGSGGSAHGGAGNGGATSVGGAGTGGATSVGGAGTGGATSVGGAGTGGATSLGGAGTGGATSLGGADAGTGGAGAQGGGAPVEAGAPVPTGAWPSSVYAAIAADVTPGVDTEILSASFDLPAATWVLVQSDGRYGPAGGHAANVFATVDGKKVTNDSYIDWTQSTNPQQHGFDAVGAVWLAAGHHEARLVADVIDGPFYVGATTNLAVMVHPADEVGAGSLAQDSAEFSYTTLGASPGVPTPHDALVSLPVAPAAASDVVALGSARAYHANVAPGTYGDAMLGLYLDGANPGNDRSTWAVNDLWTGAETQAPLFVHAFFPALSAAAHVVSLGATEFPWTGSEDSVHYKVGAGAALVVLHGGLGVRGSAPVSASKDDSIDYVGVGTDQGWPGVPPVGTDVVLAEATFDVPAGHSGVVMFSTRSRAQGDPADAGGTVTLRLVLDGAHVGNLGLQQLKSPDSVSQRTIGASFLAAGAQALAPGKHTIQAVAKAEGSFVHLAMNKDLPLLWFD